MLSRIKFYLILDFVTVVIVGVLQLSQRDLDSALMSSLTVLIAFSPICLALTTPIIFHIAKNFIESLNIKINSCESFIRFAKIDNVAFSMSNVITDGDFYITDLVPEGLSQSSLLAYAAAASSESNNILAKKICETAEHRNLKQLRVSAFRQIRGSGVEALVNNAPVRFGRPQWITSEKVEISAELLTKSDQLAAKGKTPLMLQMYQMVRGIIALKDEVDINAQKFLELLRNRNFETTLLSSESKKTVHAVVKNIKVDNVRYGLSPEDKAREVQLMRAHGKFIAMIGKDVNDIPAMMNADVSFLLRDEQAMKLIDNSIKIDFEIDRLAQFLKLKRISDKVNEIIEQNKKIAYLSWFILVPPSLMMMSNLSGVMNPLIATIGVVIFSSMIIMNSMKIKNLMRKEQSNADTDKQSNST